MNAPDPISALHAAWCAASGQDARDVNPRLTERIWFELHRAGVTPDDVRCVVAFVLRVNRRNAGGPQFRVNALKICGDLENFGGMLGEARAAERNRRPAPTPRDTVQAQREQAVDPEAARARAADQFKTLKTALETAVEQTLKPKNT